jgi:hypothetical protein
MMVLLLELGGQVIGTVPWSLRLILSWVIPEPHSSGAYSVLEKGG